LAALSSRGLMCPMLPQKPKTSSQKKKKYLNANYCMEEAHHTISTGVILLYNGYMLARGTGNREQGKL